MTAMSFDPLAIYYIIILISIPVFGLLYVAISEHWYWKGFKNGRRVTENDQSARGAR